MLCSTSSNPLISSTQLVLTQQAENVLLKMKKQENHKRKVICAEMLLVHKQQGVVAVLMKGKRKLISRCIWGSGGDAVTGAATVILAMGAGKAAAKGIDEFIKGKEN